MTLNVFKMTNMRCLTIKTYFELIYRLLVISTFDRKPISYIMCSDSGEYHQRTKTFSNIMTSLAWVIALESGINKYSSTETCCFNHPYLLDERGKNFLLVLKLMPCLQIREGNFLFLNQSICCACSKEPSQWDGSFEYTKHMFIVMVKKIMENFTLKLIFIWTVIYLSSNLSVSVCLSVCLSCWLSVLLTGWFSDCL